MQRSQLTIGIVLHNELRHLPRLLENLEEVVAPEEAEIIFVDNASTDGTLGFVERWSAYHKNRRVQIIARLNNQLALARNDVLHKTQTPWLYFWDADCGMTLESWKNHLEILNSGILDEQVVAIGGGNFPRGSQSFLLGGLESMSKNWIAHMGSLQLSQPTHFSEASVLSGCNMMVRTEQAIKAGGYDPAFHPVGEDLSLCLRLRRAGGKLWAAPHLEIEHYQNSNVARWLKKMFSYGEAQIWIGEKYPEYLKGARGIQFAAILLLGLALIAKPLIPLALFIIYSASYFVFAFKDGSYSLNKTVCGWVLSFLSHFAYAAGEVFALGDLLYSKTVPIFRQQFRSVKE